MAVDPVVELADALVAHIQTGEFDLPFDAERVWSAEYPRKSITKLKVAVAIAAEDESPASRGKFQESPILQVCFVRSLDRTAEPANPTIAKLAQVDELVWVLRQLKRRIRTSGPLGNYAYLRTENTPLFDPALLRTERLFLSILNVFYLVHST